VSLSGDRGRAISEARMTIPLAKRYEKSIRFFKNRLSPEGYAGLHLTIGVFVVLVCGWCFGAIAEDVSEGDPIVHLDQQVAVRSHEHATPGVTEVARAITFLGSVAWVSAVSLIIALFFVRRREWHRLSLLALTMFGGSALNLLLKHFFHRERPVLENPLVTLSSYGFPSGHTMGATLLYGLLALFIWNSCRSRAAPWAFASACLLILLIGLSRIYLGAHFLSDVLGALAAGFLWLTFCWTALETLRRRRIRHGNSGHR
jgi:membrane-associated phospholipid phosphatase